MPELKQLVEDLASTWESELKPRIDQIEEESKSNGTAFGETKEAVDRVQDRMDQIEAQMQKASLTPDFRQGEQPEAIKQFLDFVRNGEIPEEAKALAIRDESLGGILAPPELITDVIKGVVQYSPVRQIANIRRTSRTSVQAPKRTGVFAAQWTGETQTRTETTGQTYGLEEIPTHEMYARVLISNWDLEDAVVDLEQDVRDGMSEQFGVAEGAAFVAGNAVAKPEGILTNADIVQFANGGASFTSPDKVIDLSFQLKEQYWPNARYLLNRFSVRDLRLLKDTTNQYLWQPGVAGGAGVVEGIPATINGFPYTIATDMPTAASNALTVVFGDFKKAYWVVDRIEIAVLRDPFTAANVGQVVLHARKRVGGQVVLPEALKILKMA